MDKITIFCSASDRISPLYMEAATELGEWIGKHHKELIYGGSNAGLMECVARAVKKHGGMIMGVVPTKLEQDGKVSDLLDITFRASDLSDRKDIMVREGDIMVALPGGVGTLDEIFHVVASGIMGYHNKKVILYNINGFWDGMIDFMDKLEEQNFSHYPLKNYCIVVNTFDELVGMLA